MAQINNVLNRFVDPRFVLDADVPNQFAGRIGVAKNHWYPSGREFGSHAPVHGRGNNCDAANVALPELSYDCLGSFRIVFGVAKQHVKSAVPRHGLIASDDLGKIWIGNFGNDESK